MNNNTQPFAKMEEKLWEQTANSEKIKPPANVQHAKQWRQRMIWNLIFVARTSRRKSRL